MTVPKCSVQTRSDDKKMTMDGVNMEGFSEEEGLESVLKVNRL